MSDERSHALELEFVLPEPVNSRASKTVPRIAARLALAMKYEELLLQGAASSYADLSGTAMASRSRVSHVMNLLNLAPDIQEAILFAKPTSAVARLREKDIRTIAREVEWSKQREMWRGHLPLVSAGNFRS